MVTLSGATPLCIMACWAFCAAALLEGVFCLAAALKKILNLYNGPDSAVRTHQPRIETSGPTMAFRNTLLEAFCCKRIRRPGRRVITRSVFTSPTRNTAHPTSLGTSNDLTKKFHRCLPELTSERKFFTACVILIVPPNAVLLTEVYNAPQMLRQQSNNGHMIHNNSSRPYLSAPWHDTVVGPEIAQLIITPT